jgi:AmmeMemoRadiSam system protein B
MNRAAAVAGTWYPGTAGALAREVDQYLGAVGIVPSGRIDAVIVPHAGIMFSGPVAAHAYRAAAAAGPYDAALLVGPSHYVAFDGVALYPSGVFECPLGPAVIDEPLAAELISSSSVIRPLPTAHTREHSLEMQLPFLKRVLPDLPIVPLLIGYQTADTIEQLAAALAHVSTTKRLLLVASSDLSHYFDAATAARLDKRVQDCVAAFDTVRLLALFEQYPEGERGRYVACGGGAIIAVMMAAKARGAKAARMLNYAHSGDVSGDNSGVVGYLAGACGDFLDAH